MVTVHSDRAHDVDAAIRCVEFPRLTSLTMNLDGYGDGTYVPRLEKHQVISMHIDPPFDVNPDSYGVIRDEMDIIMDQIPVVNPYLGCWGRAAPKLTCYQIVFPDLEFLSFIDRTRVHVGSLKRLAERLPYL